MTESIAIQPIGPFNATLRPPASKSLTNRALLLAALADGDCTIHNVLRADDTRYMHDALVALGFELEPTDKGRSVRLRGAAGEIRAAHAALDLGNAGTAMRPLTAACCLGSGTYVLDGTSRMRERPIGELVEPLRRIGARIEYLGRGGYPPLEITGGRLAGGAIEMAPTLSSQFVTALLMIGPYCEQGLTIRFDGPITSRPYVEMTIGLMAWFGIEAETDSGLRTVRVGPGVYCARDYTVEPDATSATYFLATAAVVPLSRCTIEGLGARSLQGDVGFVQVLEQMGARMTQDEHVIAAASPDNGRRLRGIDTDLNRMPDAAMTLAAIAPMAEGATVIRNIGNLRVKETDRLAALRNELTKLGAGVDLAGPDLRIEPPADGEIRPATIDTYGDHRMAMSFAVVGLARPGIVINDPTCVDKTFPGFFGYLDRLRTPDGAAPVARPTTGADDAVGTEP